MKELKIQIKGSYKLESTFTTAWHKELKNKGYWVYKLTDASLGKKPFDSIIATDKNIYCVEIKVINKDIFHIDKLRPNQIAALRKINNLRPGSAIICVYSKSLNKYKIFSFDKIKDIDYNDSTKLEFN